MQPRYRNLLRRTLQSGVAAALSYLACLALGLSEFSWAVISALFVLQSSADATVSAAGGRLAGTIAGTLLGLGSIQFLGGADLIAERLAIVAAALGALTALRPEMRYAVVAGSIIALETDPSVLGPALERGASILVGTLVGVLVTLLLWPERAASAALRHIRSALDCCRALIDAELQQVTTGEDQKFDRYHRNYPEHIRKARASADDALIGRRREGAPIGDLVHHASRLWHSLIMLDRVLERDEQARLADKPEMRDAIDQVREAACGYLKGRVRDERDGHGARLNRVTAAVTCACETISGSDEHMELQPLAFSLGELRRTLVALERAFASEADGDGEPKLRRTATSSA